MGWGFFVDKRVKQIDWDGVKSEYRAGQLSIREIGRRFIVSDTAIRKKAKEKGWRRSLAKRVRREVREKIVRADSSQKVRTANLAEDESEASDKIVDAAADRGMQVVMSHRADINKLKKAEQDLLAELGDKDNRPTKLYISQYRGQIVEREIPYQITELTQALNNLANVQHKRIQLERQAFSLDDGPADIPAAGKWTVEFKGAADGS